MKVSEVAALLSAKIIQGEYTDREVEGAYTSDLLSDVMGNAPDNGVLITIQAHKNTIAVATLKDLGAIIVCNNRPIPDDMIEAAKDEDVAILLCQESQYIVSGKLYQALNK